MNAHQRRKFLRKIARELPPGTEVIHCLHGRGGFGKVVEIKPRHSSRNFGRCVLVEWPSGSRQWENPVELLMR